MAWWDEMLGLLKEEWTALGPKGSAHEPPTVKQAEALLTRTAKELAAAKARAEAARRRMLRAQRELQALTEDPKQHPSYRERLSELARAVAHEGDMARSFDDHIATLARLHAGVEAQLREFHRDVSMARTMMAAANATAAAPDSPPRKPADKSPGFAHQRPDKVMDQLKRGPRGRG